METILLNILFAFTAAMVFTGIWRFLSIMVGNPIVLPFIFWPIALKPDQGYVWYPSLGYQFYFWASYAGVLS